MSMTTFATFKLLFMLLLFLLPIQTIALEIFNVKANPTRIEKNERGKQILKQIKKTSLNEETKLNKIKNATYKLVRPQMLENVVKFKTQTMEEKTKIAVNIENANSKLTKRSKRQHLSTMTSLNEITTVNQQMGLPAVPLPPPPPFLNNNFKLTPFASSGTVLNDFAFENQQHQTHISASLTTHKCGGVFKSRHGVIQTPNFPHKFTTPIECVWIVDASDLMPHAGHNISIVVYLTQLYVLGGLKFTEYMYYSDDYKVPAHRVFTLTEDDVTQVAWIQFNSQYLEIRFRMSSLDGTHLRALDRLLDVYGFNMTYEVEPVKEYQCNTLQCRFLGHCYAKADFSSYFCSCFPGFSGMDCGRGPLCQDPHTNICQNGGTCKHIGDAAITCHCPNGFKGTKCEIPDISETTMGCTSNSSALDCHRECDFDSGKEGGISLLKSSRTSARSGKTRFEVTIRLGANLTAYYRNIEGEKRTPEQLPTFLEKHVSSKKYF